MILFCTDPTCRWAEPPELGDEAQRAASQLLHRSDLIIHLLHHLLHQGATLSDQQDAINAAVAVLTADATGLDAAVARITAFIEANPGIDTSALTQTVSDLQGHVDAVNAIVPESPTP